MSDLLLTIAIPVFNGERYMAGTLDSIRQALSDKTIIEVVISDNASTDNTSNIIENYKNLGMNLCYYCNDVNLGYDKNIDALIERSHGKYVWILGCGEKVKCDAIRRLISKLSVPVEHTNILLDFDIYEESKNKITDDRVFDFDEDIVLEGKNNFLYNRYSPAVSSNIVNREKWLSVAKKPLVVDGWCHVERILHMIATAESNKTLFLPKPFFTLFREKDGWWTKPDSYLLLLLHIKIIRNMKTMGFSAAVVERLENKQKYLNLMNAVIQAKYSGLKIDKKVVLDMISMFKNNLFFWAFVLPTLFMPKFLIIIPRICLKLITEMKKLLRYVKKTFC